MHFKPLTPAQQAALSAELQREGGAYHLACRDEVSLRELDDLRQRGLLNEGLSMTDSGRVVAGALHVQALR